MSLRSGKLSWSMLFKLLSLLPTSDIDVVMGPGIGEDAAIIRFKDGFLVIHSDPITAASRKIGWLAIHIAANDIAVRGVKPKWFLPTVLLPENTDQGQVEEIFADMGKALNELGAVAVGGHTEVTPSLDRPIIAVTAAGYTRNRVIMTRDARPGDKVLLIGVVGGEGAAVIAWDFMNKLLEKNVDRDIINKARDLLWRISVVEKALSIRDYVNSMHDPTEGGILQGLREVAMASNTSVIIDLDEIVLDDVVTSISSAVGVDPLRLLSSGTLIATVSPEKLDDVKNILENKGYTYSVCGYISSEEPGKVFLKKNNKIVEVIDNDIIDEIYKLWT